MTAPSLLADSDPMAFHPLDARRPTDLLRTSSTLRALLEKSRQLERLQALFQSRLEPAAREQCRVASFENGVLKLVVTSSQWATRMRYQQKRLIRDLQTFNEFATLTKIHCKVQPPLVKKSPPVRTIRRSKVASHSLQETGTQSGAQSPRAAPRRIGKPLIGRAGTGSRPKLQAASCKLQAASQKLEWKHRTLGRGLRPDS